MSTSTTEFRLTDPNAILSSTVCSLGYVPTGRVVFLFIKDRKLMLSASVDQRGLMEHRDLTIKQMRRAEKHAGAPVGMIICWETDNSVPADMNDEFNPEAVIVVRKDRWDYASNGNHSHGTVDLADATAMKYAVECGVDITTRDRDDMAAKYAPGITSLRPVKSSSNPITLLNDARNNPAHLLNGLSNRKNKARPMRDILLGLMVVEDDDQFWLDQCLAALNAANDEQVVEVAAVTAAIAYLDGDGVTANIVLDIAHTADPQHTLSDLMRQAISSAIPPQALRPIFTSSLTATQAAHKAAS